MNRAYSILTLKAVDAEKRVIRGMATTPTPDRMGDVVEPKGVKFNNPMPLLWQHKADKPVGTATFGKPTEDGIAFEAHIEKSDGVQSQTLRDRFDEAWESVKLGLVRAVSIGFKPLEYAFLEKTDGIHFLETEVMELSLVTIPANSEATISQIKSIDHPLLAATGMTVADSDRPKPGVSGSRKSLKEKKMPKTIAEQISAFEATRAAKAARMDELMQKAADGGVTLDDAESDEYDTLEGEVKKIDEHLVRLSALKKQNEAKAKPADDIVTANQRAALNGTGVIHVNKPDLPKGTAFTRLAMALTYAKGNRWEAQNYAKQWKDQTPEVALVLEHDIPMMMKAAQGAGTTTDANFASPLIVYQVMASEFAELLRPATIIGRIPGLRRVPFNIQMPATTQGSTMGWVGEQAPKPVSAMAFTTITLRWAKAAGIVVLTDELVRFSNPAAEAVVRNDMIAAMAQFLDRQFVDPAVAAVPNVSPASITNGVTPIVASGNTPTAFKADMAALFNTFLAANLSAADGVFIMTQQQALAISLMTNPLGQYIYPSVTAAGGTLIGYPVVASENIPGVGGSPFDGLPLIFCKPSEIMLADDGQTVIDASNQASIQMDSAPDSPPSASSILVSLWQMNMTGLRAERWINWAKRRTSAVAYISNAKYSG